LDATISYRQPSNALLEPTVPISQIIDNQLNERDWHHLYLHNNEFQSYELILQIAVITLNLIETECWNGRNPGEQEVKVGG